MLAAQNRARERTGNPVAADEARRLGERAEPEPDWGVPAGTVDEAAARLARILPVEAMETWAQLDTGEWVCRETGLVRDQAPTRCTL